MAESGLIPCYNYVPQTLGELPYDKWREYHADDADWRFLDGLKRELKVRSEFCEGLDLSSIQVSVS
jgi:hypothetical protein